MELRHTQITGEMRQAFKALLRLPPTQYLAPGEHSDAVERENATYEQLVEEPVHCNPYLLPQQGVHAEEGVQGGGKGSTEVGKRSGETRVKGTPPARWGPLPRPAGAARALRAPPVAPKRNISSKPPSSHFQETFRRNLARDLIFTRVRQRRDDGVSSKYPVCRRNCSYPQLPT